MAMKLRVLGSSPAWPNPGSVHAGYLLEEDGRRLLLDCGPGVLGRLLTAGLLPVDAIVLTHFHLDHWGDVVPWVWLAEHGGMPAGDVDLWIPPNGRAELDAFSGRWGSAGMFDRAFEVQAYGAMRPFAAAGFEVVAHPVEHYGMEAYGLRVTSQGGRILAYSGDAAPGECVREIGVGADLFLCEATLADGAPDGTPRGHMSAAEALAHASGRILLTHRPAELPTPDGAGRASDGLEVDV
jgi:ribonuclease BN (tRNA processing enzyme)